MHKCIKNYEGNKALQIIDTASTLCNYKIIIKLSTEAVTKIAVL